MANDFLRKCPRWIQWIILAITTLMSGMFLLGGFLMPFSVVPPSHEIDWHLVPTIYRILSGLGWIWVSTVLIDWVVDDHPA